MVFSGPTNIRGKSLYTIIDGLTWEEAELNANKLGGNLVTIDDEDENNWLVDTYSNYFDNDQNINRAWIGLYQNQVNTYDDFYDNKSNSWEWSSGELDDYRSNRALTFEGGPILTYIPEVYQVQTQILIEDHSFELYDFDNEAFENVHQNNAVSILAQLH